MFLILGLLLTMLFGLSLTLWLIPKIHPLGRLGLAYLLGLGILTLFMFGFILAGINLNSVNLLGLLILLNLVVSLPRRKKLSSYKGEVEETIRKTSFSRNEKGLVAVIIIINALVLIFSLYLPIRDWDSVTLYDYRGRMLTDSAYATAYANGEMYHYYYGYPLLTSLSHSLVYALGGSNPLFLSGLFFLSLSLLFFSSLREISSRVLSLIITLILVCNVALIQHATVAYANLPYSIYFAMGSIFMYLWMIKKEIGYFITSCLLILLSIWCRDSEPFWISIFVTLLLYTVRTGLSLKPAYFLFAVLPLRFLWGNLKDRVGTWVTTDQFSNSLSILSNFSINRVFEVIGFLHFALNQLYIPVILLFLLTILFDFKDVLKAKRLYLLVMILASLGIYFVGTYIFSFMFSDWQKIPGSAERVFMLFPILILYYVAHTIEARKIFEISKI